MTRKEQIEKALDSNDKQTYWESFVAGAEWADSTNLECKHPGCCCVCGHQGKCPEDGSIATGGTYE